ncbi:hypothetical protein HAX54_044415 [Datura stramonium]|uniref:Uncharacterized protein n=1 Tax=Datura stramonium TaxID=4076 RepID=A0ABS8WEL0_DATST|nr:hypothetical protein [Datura stramonium]
MNSSQEKSIDSEQVQNLRNEQNLGVAVQNQILVPEMVLMGEELKTRDSLKRGQQNERMNKEGVDNKLVLVTEQADLSVPPRQVHESPRDCTLNSISMVSDDINDYYRVIHFEDEFDQDTQSIGAEEHDDEEDEETSDHLIKAFGPTIDSDLLKEI